MTEKGLHGCHCWLTSAGPYPVSEQNQKVLASSD